MHKPLPTFLLPVMFSLAFAAATAACGGDVRASDDAGACPADSEYCCPPGAYCLPPRTTPLDAGLEAAAVDGSCPPGETCHPPPPPTLLMDAGKEPAVADAGGCSGANGEDCCPDGAICLPPSNLAPDAGADGAPVDAAPSDAGTCPDGEYLVFPCCGGFDNMTCSNGGNGTPPQPFCAAIPASCDGQTMCTLGGCVGELDPTQRTLGCNCI